MHGLARSPLRLLIWLILVISLTPCHSGLKTPESDWIYLSRPGEHLDAIGERFSEAGTSLVRPDSVQRTQRALPAQARHPIRFRSAG